jgi:flagellar hook-associated protein 3 FlgL
MTTRIATIALQNQILGRVLDTQSRLADAQIQVSSGRTAQTFSGLSGQANKLVSLETTYLRTERFIDNNNNVIERLQAMENNVAAIFDVATEVRTLIIAALNSSGGTAVPLPTEATNQLNEVVSLLNEQFDGRYLFAGSMTNTTPVDLTAFSGPAPSVYPTSADTDYYQGDSLQLAVHADVNNDVTYGVTADESAFEEIIRALRLASTATMNPVDTDRLDEALRVVNKSIDALPDIRSRIGVTISTLEKVNSKHGNFQSFTEKSIIDIEHVDVAEAMTRLASEQTMLEASYLTVSRLFSVSLVTYLR